MQVIVSKFLKTLLVSSKSCNLTKKTATNAACLIVKLSNQVAITFFFLTTKTNFNEKVQQFLVDTNFFIGSTFSLLSGPADLRPRY